MSNPLVAGQTASDRGERSPRAGRTWTPLSRALEAAGDHWTLPIALALAPGRTRLAHLRERLPGISTGVLERGLQQMVSQGLVSRSRFKEKPPRVELELTDAGRELVPIAEALASWGMRHLWSRPQERERVDVAALLRLLPSIVGARAELPDGALEAVLTGPDAPERFRYRVSGGHLSIVEESRQPRTGSEPTREPPPAPGRTSATLEGNAEAWIAALVPTAEANALQVTGDEPLARRVLAVLPGSATAVCHNGGRGGQRRDPQGT